MAAVPIEDADLPSGALVLKFGEDAGVYEVQSDGSILTQGKSRSLDKTRPLDNDGTHKVNKDNDTKRRKDLHRAVDRYHGGNADFQNADRPRRYSVDQIKKKAKAKSRRSNTSQDTPLNAELKEACEWMEAQVTKAKKMVSQRGTLRCQCDFA